MIIIIVKKTFGDRTMNHLTRRRLLTGFAVAGAASLSDGAIGSAASRPSIADAHSATAAPPWPPARRKAAADKLLEYFRSLAPKMLRPPQGILRHPSISPSLPGAAYNTQLWDWDTLWTSRALFRLADMTRDRSLFQKVCLHTQGSLLDFLDHQSEDGRISIMIDIHNPDPFGCLKTAAPNHNNQAKPVFGQLALLISDELKSVEWLRPRFDQLMRFYHSWILGNQASLGLLVWGDDVAIGDDNDPTTFGRPFFSSANLLLNSLYYQDLKAAAELARRLNRPREAKRLAGMAHDQGMNIQKYCWDPRDRFYYTVDVQCVDRRAELIPWDKHEGMSMSWKCLPLRIQMFTGFLPMWAGLATSQQAELLVKEHYLNPQTFNSPYGVRSLSRQETMYSLQFSSNPSDWLGPVWILTNYFVWTGLKTYGYHKEAAVLADKTLRLLADDLAKHGCLNEYYHPETGVPLGHKGFLDWNMLVLEMV